MESKILDKIHNHLPVIQSICDRWGWDGNHAEPIHKDCIVQFRTFFTQLLKAILLKDLPDPADVYPDRLGGISILWDKPVDAETIDYDCLEVLIMQDSTASYSGIIESLKIETHSFFDLTEEIPEELVRYINFFK